MISPLAVLTFTPVTWLSETRTSPLTVPTVSGPLIKRYKQNLAAYRAELYDFCTRRGVSCLFTSTDVPFERLVLTSLRQRGLVR